MKLIFFILYCSHSLQQCVVSISYLFDLPLFEFAIHIFFTIFLWLFFLNQSHILPHNEHRSSFFIKTCQHNDVLIDLVTPLQSKRCSIYLASSYIHVCATHNLLVQTVLSDIYYFSNNSCNIADII